MESGEKSGPRIQLFSRSASLSLNVHDTKLSSLGSGKSKNASGRSLECLNFQRLPLKIALVKKNLSETKQRQEYKLARSVATKFLKIEFLEVTIIQKRQNGSLSNCLREKSVFRRNTLFSPTPFPDAESLVTFNLD